MIRTTLFSPPSTISSSYLKAMHLSPASELLASHRQHCSLLCTTSSRSRSQPWSLPTSTLLPSNPRSIMIPRRSHPTRRQK
ncbi:hypothetical protein BHE74_00010207 [Ensete ventricosum]|nr:hypothetical protein BHE74_00010207 [Ensete ventricosum]